MNRWRGIHPAESDNRPALLLYYSHCRAWKPTLLLWKSPGNRHTFKTSAQKHEPSPVKINPVVNAVSKYYNIRVRFFFFFVFLSLDPRTTPSTKFDDTAYPIPEICSFTVRKPTFSWTKLREYRYEYQRCTLDNGSKLSGCSKESHSGDRDFFASSTFGKAGLCGIEPRRMFVDQIEVSEGNPSVYNICTEVFFLLNVDVPEETLNPTSRFSKSVDGNVHVIVFVQMSQSRQHNARIKNIFLVFFNCSGCNYTKTNALVRTNWILK